MVGLTEGVTSSPPEHLWEEPDGMAALSEGPETTDTLPNLGVLLRLQNSETVKTTMASTACSATLLTLSLFWVYIVCHGYNL